MKNMTTANQPKSDNQPLGSTFIHSDLDDHGLTVHQFRVFCHIARRAGKSSAYPSTKSIASVCRMKRDTVFDAIKALESMKLIQINRRYGMPSTYTINQSCHWQPVPRNGATPNEGTPPETGQHPSPETGQPPTPNGGTLSISKEVNPSKCIQYPPNPPQGEQGQDEFRLDPESPEKPKAKKAAKSKPPSLDEWLAYAKDVSPEWAADADNCESAFDHYEANGWRQNKGTPIKDWKAACRNCHKFWKQRNPQKQKSKPTTSTAKRTADDPAAKAIWNYTYTNMRACKSSEESARRDADEQVEKYVTGQINP